jgi:hypothetical protein
MRKYKAKYPDIVRARARKRTARWRAANPRRTKEIRLACYHRNPEKWRKYHKRYRTKHPTEHNDHYRKRQREWMAGKRKTDPTFRLLGILRTRLVAVLKGKAKATSTIRLLGCSIADFKIYLESRFQSGMSWDNYGNKAGQWSVDHIMPCAIFDLSKPEHQKRCFHFSNLRPLWHIENMRKHTKLTTNQYNLL